ncbi:MAG: DRTGG domain-containing protein [Oscillospiraceae bacterium]
MKIQEIVNLLNATVITKEIDLDTEVHTACGSDMMSDVLAYVKNQAVLVTGLNNPQVIRTAEMMDMVCVVYVRGKQPDAMSIRLATEKGICVLTTEIPMFACCGILYSNGLRGA